MFAKSYYVDPSSWGSNTGTFTDPWRSLADIPATINYFQPGDTVFFQRGQWYYGTLSINSSGQYGAPIVFMPYGWGNAPLFQYAPINPNEYLPANKTIIRLNQANNIVIDGFELTDNSIADYDHSATANVGYGVYIYGGGTGNGSYNVIKNLTISHVGAGVMIDGGGHNTITNCTIRNLHMIVNTPGIMWDDTGATGIILAGSDNTISYNKIQDCYAFSYDYQFDGGAIEMYGPVWNNNILYNTAINNLGFMEFGSSTGGQALSNLVAYNLLINNGNVVWINSANGFGVDVRNLQLFNNNIVETSAPRLPYVTSLIGISSTPYVGNVVNMKNNIFWITTPVNITDPVAQLFNGPQLIHQNNLYHLSGGAPGFALDYSEQNLNPGIPLFTDISSGDPALWNYELLQSAAAINFGQAIGISKDFYGQSVPVSGAPDAGIAEHTSYAEQSRQAIACANCSGANGLVGAVKNDLITFPNPAQSDLYLQFLDDDFRNKEMVLVNMSGVEISRAKFNDVNNRVKLNVSTLPRGVYVIKLVDNKTGNHYKTTFIK